LIGFIGTAKAVPLQNSTFTTGCKGGTLSLAAVIFDYGMVLSAAPLAEAHDAMVRITGLPIEQFESLYWDDRPAYDRGDLTGIGFWRNFARRASLDLDEGTIEELNRQDARMWTTQNAAVLQWQQALKRRGLRTAILSNMGDTVFESVDRAFAWIHDFDVCVWSYQVRLVKPDAAIYRLTLDRIGIAPDEALFLDDKQPNIDAARALGMHAIQFSTVEKLRADILTSGFGGELPLP
jgi:putative hydrolase of the HAD superfamily